MKKFFTPPRLGILVILLLTLMMATAAAESCPDCGKTMAAANCVAPPTCTSCGYKDWDTGKDSNNHGELVVENRFDNQGAWHYYRCTLCKLAATDPVLCRYSNWKYVDDSEHIGTCSVCGMTATYDHHDSNGYSSDSTNHYFDCTACTYFSSAAHTFGDWTSGGTSNHSRTCTVCGYTATESHVMETYCQDPDLYNESTHTLGCTKCTYSVTSKHVMIDYECNNDEVHRSKCQNCVYMIWPAHTFKYVDNGTTHTGTCTACGDQVTGSHQFETIYSYTNKVHTWVCTICKCAYAEAHTLTEWDAVDTSSCTRYCTTAKCNYSETLTHNWVYFDVGAETYHSGECSRCGHGTGAAHNYGDWTRADGDNHQRTCSTCSHVQTQAHTGGTATCLTPKICTVCNTQYGPANGHGDTYATTVKKPSCATGEAGLVEIRCVDCDMLLTTAKPTAQHNPEMTTIVAATCCDDGYSQLICTNCKQAVNNGQKYPIDATGNHVEDWRVTKAATCTAEGTETLYCGYSNKSLGNTRSIPMIDHVESDPVISPQATCCNTGLKSWYCVSCHKLLRTQTIPALGHTSEGSYKWVVATEPTCTKTGLEKKVCSHSGTALGETRTLPALGHNLDAGVTTKATCTKEGKTVYTCQRPGCTHTETTVLPMIDHVESDPVISPQATCCNTGLKSWYCVSCHKLLRTQTIPALGHTSEGSYKWVVATEPTCTKTGLEKKVCSHSGTALGETRTLPALGHKLDSGVTTKATCTKEGKTVKTCQRPGCTHTETTVLPMADHVEGSPVVSPQPTCCNTGLKSWYCVNCRKLLRTQTIPALGHTSEGSYKWVKVSDPTCTEVGVEKKVCAHSGNELGETRTTPALGHIYVGLWESGDSDTHYRNCYRCGAGRKIVECTYLPLEIDGAMYQVCPVCGRFHDQALEVVSEATINLATGNKPGNSLVRMLAQPFGADEARYPIILTAIFEAEGYIAEPAANVTGITVRVPLNTTTAFKLVFVHMDDVTSELVWTDVAYTLENGVLTFTVEEMGLFLFVAE